MHVVYPYHTHLYAKSASQEQKRRSLPEQVNPSIINRHLCCTSHCSIRLSVDDDHGAWRWYGPQRDGPRWDEPWTCWARYANANAGRAVLCKHNQFGSIDSANEQMNMLWNNDIQDVCVVFSSWHITGPVTMAISWYVHLLSIDKRQS